MNVNEQKKKMVKTIYFMKIHSIILYLPHRRRVGKGEFHPQASHRTVRDSLQSYGSCYSWYASTISHFPVIKQRWVRLSYRIEFCPWFLAVCVLPPGCTQLVLFCVRVYSFVNHPPQGGGPPHKVVVVNNALNNLSPSLLSVFTDYLHFYGLVRLPFHVFSSRYPETDIPCSTI